MNFIDWGAFSLFSLIPVVILFYLLKLRRTPFYVSSNFLWIQAFKDSKANTPFQKLRRNILLILQILALILFILIKSRPFLKTSYQEGNCSVLIIDNSASMKAKDTITSRFDEARKMGLKLIQQMKSNDQMMIISVNSRPKVETTFTQNKRILAKIMNDIMPVDGTTEMKDALILAISSLKTYKDSRIFLLSDGAFKIDDLGLKIPPITFLSFGNNSDNIGITNINLRSNPFSKDHLDILVEIENFSNEQKKFALEMYIKDQLIEAHQVNMKIGEKKWEIFQDIYAQSSIVNFKIDKEDMLDTDNKAYAVISPPNSVKILLVSEGNTFLEHLLEITPNITTFIIKPQEYNGSNQADIVIFDKGKISKIDKGNFIFFGSQVTINGLNIIGEVQKPDIISWDNKHPVMRFIDFSDVHISKALKINNPSNGKVLVESDVTPLICSIVEKDLKALFIGFDLENSDIALRPAFPILISNAIQWFNPPFSNISSYLLKTGEMINIFHDFNNITIISPDNKAIFIKPEYNKNILFSDTFIAGIYEIQQGHNRKYIAVNLANESESNIKPEKNILIGSQNIASSSVNSIGKREIWRIFAIIVIGLLILEWYIFHKRVS